MIIGSLSEDDVTRRDPEGNLVREVRLGLVMNGGVSLAIWIGGVTHEIDCLRRAADASANELSMRPTSGCYRDLLAILRERVLVDVVAGASAGGINGGLLAAAVYSEIPLPPLREIWITLGDFATLLRSPSRREPPSLLRGDDVVLPQLRRTFEAILSAAGSGPADQPIYLYVTATDFYGTPVVFADSGKRRFQESDHRKVFVFEHPAAPGHEIEAEAIAEVTDTVPGAMPDVGTFDLQNAADLLARAARSSSSFPVAFEAHGLTLEDARQHWMIDGGVLDNQPFNPVLNRIATIDAGDIPIRRVVGYIVPYVTVPKSEPDDGLGARRPTARETSSAASSLPRDLPKLDGLKRITNELSDGRRAHQSRDRFTRFAEGDSLEPTAVALFEAYRQTRYADCFETFASWDADEFRPGAGEIGQLETVEPREALVGPIASNAGDVPNGLLWVPDRDGRVWSSGSRWTWGLSPSERIAAEALSAFRRLLRADPANAQIATAKGFSSGLVQTIRAMKFRASVEFQNTKGTGTRLERGLRVYAEPVIQLTQSFGVLETQLNGIPGAPPLQRLIDGEVVRNAFSTEKHAVPPVFDFIHMSAGIRNSLGHQDETPESKLAGMKLGHFAGFLKRSWRANDWMWGRLDGAEYAVSCVLDLDYLGIVPDIGAVISELRDFAFPPDDHAILFDSWARTLNAARVRRYIVPGVAQAVNHELDELATTDPRDAFVAVLENAAGEGDADVRAALLDCCRAALVARIQLQILEEELPEVAAAIEQDLKNGASRGSSGAEWVLRDTGGTAQDRVARFRSLRIGSEEEPQQEASSKLGMDVASTAVAVAAAAFSGSHGGLPAAIRAPLGAVRGLTLVFNIIVRLLVRTPVFGIAAVVAAAVALVWALIEPTALLGAAIPGLAALVIGGATVLIAMATSPLEAPSRSGWQRAGLLGIIAVPLGILALILGLPLGWEADVRWLLDAPLATGEPASWLSKHTTGTASDIARWFVVAAGAASVLRTLLGWRSRKFRVVDLWIYRWGLLLAAGAVAGGIVYNRAVDTDRSWNGTILMLILFGAISLAPLVAELASGGRWALRRVFGAER